MLLFGGCVNGTASLSLAADLESRLWLMPPQILAVRRLANDINDMLIVANGTPARHLSLMKTASVQEVAKQWTKILQWLAAGEEVRVTSKGKPVARLTPYAKEGAFIGATPGGPALPQDVDEPTGEKW